MHIKHACSHTCLHKTHMLTITFLCPKLKQTCQLDDFREQRGQGHTMQDSVQVGQPPDYLGVTAGSKTLSLIALAIPSPAQISLHLQEPCAYDSAHYYSRPGLVGKTIFLKKKRQSVGLSGVPESGFTWCCRAQACGYHLTELGDQAGV